MMNRGNIIWGSLCLAIIVIAFLAQGAGIITPSVRLTPEGGYAVRLTNDTGSTTLKGALVGPSGAADSAFSLEVNAYSNPIGVCYETGVTHGGQCWVVTGGIAWVLLTDGTATTRGNWLATSLTQTGRVSGDTGNDPPGGGVPELDRHMAEVGHCIQGGAAGTNSSALAILHMN